jgi:Photosynthetic reaction centre cytochrome C subunit
MLYTKKIKTLVALAVFVLLGVAATKAPFQKVRNLKVLPADISEQRLDSIMQTYNVALGVKCDFCHVKSAMWNVNGLDYAADTEPMKENAREMMRMTIEINKNNFYFDKKKEPYLLRTVTCKTCHRGEPFPSED